MSCIYRHITDEISSMLLVYILTGVPYTISVLSSRFGEHPCMYSLTWDTIHTDEYSIKNIVIKTLKVIIIFTILFYIYIYIFIYIYIYIYFCLFL